MFLIDLGSVLSKGGPICVDFCFKGSVGGQGDDGMTAHLQQSHCKGAQIQLQTVDRAIDKVSEVNSLPRGLNATVTSHL